MKQKYSSLKDLEDDMTLMWSNARTFNGRSFQVSDRGERRGENGS